MLTTKLSTLSTLKFISIAYTIAKFKSVNFKVPWLKSRAKFKLYFRKNESILQFADWPISKFQTDPHSSFQADILLSCWYSTTQVLMPILSNNSQFKTIVSDRFRFSSIKTNDILYSSFQSEHIQFISFQIDFICCSFIQYPILKPLQNRL